jgi:hypothetical protein
MIAAPHSRIRRRPWTVVEWGAFARRCREVRDRIDLAIREMPETAGVTTRHGNLLIEVHGRMVAALMTVESGFASQHPDRENDAIRLAHGDAPRGWGRCRGRVRKFAPKLTRAEWIAWGERIKAIDRDVSALLLEFQGTTAGPGIRRFLAVSRALSRVRSGFDDLVCRQHPDWANADQVFYGESSPTSETFPP